MAKVGEIRANLVLNAKSWDAAWIVSKQTVQTAGAEIAGGLGLIQGELRRTSESWQKSGQAQKEAAEAERRAAAAATAAQQERLANRLSAIKQLSALGQISTKEEIGELRKVLKEEELTGAERRRIAEQITNLKVKLAKQAADAEVAAARQAEQAERDRVARQQAESVANIDRRTARAETLGAGAEFFGQISAGLGTLRAEFAQTGQASQDLRNNLRQAFGDAAEDVAKIAERKISLGLDQDQAEEALKVLNRFGLATEQNFSRVVDASKRSGQELGSLTENYVRFAQLKKPEFLESFMEDAGIAAAEMQRFGAALDANGEVLLDTSARQQAALDALNQVLDSKFVGSFEKGATASQKLKGELDLLTGEVGRSVIAFKDEFAPALIPVVQGLRDLPAGMKAAIGIGTEFVGVGASMAATSLQVGANLVILSTNTALVTAAQNTCLVAVGLLRSGLLGLLGAISPLTVVLGAVAAGLALYTKGMEEANAAAEDLLKTEEARLRGYAKNKDLLGKTAQEIAAMGRTTKDVGELMAGLQDQIQAARESGNDALALKLIAQQKALRAERAKLEELQQAQKATDIAAPSEKDQAKADKDAAALREQRRKEELDAALDAVAIRAAGHELSKRQEIAALQQVLDEFRKAGKIKADEARSLELKIAQLRGQVLDKAAADEKARDQKIAADKQAAARQQQQLAKEAVSAQIAEVEAQIKAAEGKVDSGSIGRLEALHRRKLALIIQEIQAERDAAVATATNASVKVQAVETAEAKIRAARARTRQELDAERQKLDKATEQEATKAQGQIDQLSGQALEAQQKALDVQLKALEDNLGKLGSVQTPRELKDITAALGVAERDLSRYASGQALLPAIEATVKRKLELTIQQINAERDAILATESNEELRAAAVRAAEEKVKTARAESTQQAKEELDKQHNDIRAFVDKHAQAQDQIRQKAITSQVGGKNSPIFSDAAEGLGISLGSFALGDFGVAKPTASAVSRDTVTKDLKVTAQAQPDAKLAPAASGDIAKAVREGVEAAFAKNPMQVTVQVSADGAQESKTFSGTPGQLSQAQNIFNPDFTLGRP